MQIYASAVGLSASYALAYILVTYCIEAKVKRSYLLENYKIFKSRHYICSNSSRWMFLSKMNLFIYWIKSWSLDS